MYDTFKIDPTLEKAGLMVEFRNLAGKPDFRVRVALAGITNKDFTKALDAAMKPHERARKAGAMDVELQLAITREVFAKTIVKSWEVFSNPDYKVGDEILPEHWKSGIEQPDGSVAPFTVANVNQCFINLPVVYSTLLEKATNETLYREELREEDAKN